MKKEYVVVVANEENLADFHEEILMLEEENPFEHARAICDDYNKEEDRRKEITQGKYPVRKRTVLSVSKKSDDTVCDFVKISLMSVQDHKGFYDMCACKRCGLKVKRYGLVLPTYWNTKKCFPELVCLECNKEFKTLKGATAHKLLHSPIPPNAKASGILGGDL